MKQSDPGIRTCRDCDRRIAWGKRNIAGVVLPYEKWIKTCWDCRLKRRGKLHAVK